MIKTKPNPKKRDQKADDKKQSKVVKTFGNAAVKETESKQEKKQWSKDGPQKKQWSKDGPQKKEWRNKGEKKDGGKKEGKDGAPILNRR